MRANAIILFLFLIGVSTSFGQSTFQKSIETTMDTSFIRCLPNGQAFFLVGQIKKNGQLHVNCLKLNASGGLLWRKEYVYSDAYNVKTLTLQSDAIIVVVSSESDAFLLKINQSNGANIWQKRIGQSEKVQLYTAECDDKDNIWLNGLHLKSNPSDSNYYFQIKTDKNATPIKAKKCIFLSDTLKFTDTRSIKLTNLMWQASSNSMVCVEDFNAPFTRVNDYVFNKGRKQVVFSDGDMNYVEQYLEQNFIDIVVADKNFAFSGTDFKDSSKYLIGIMNEQCTQYLQLRYIDDYLQPIHNNDGSIVFYSLKYKTLTKYDNQLKAIWCKKYDNCINTATFAADIAQDGSIFTVRNLAGKTVVSRINPDGSLPDCIDYNEKSTPNTDHEKVPSVTNIVQLLSYNYQPLKDTLIVASDVNINPVPICFKIDASFNIPDTVCISNSITPTEVDTNETLKHSWNFNSKNSTNIFPSIRFDDLGLQRIYHSVERNGCKDTADNFVYMIPVPIIGLKDTVVCGKKDITIDLTSKFSKFYFINGRETQPVIKIDSSGSYNFTITTKNCRVESKVKVKINDFQLPTFHQDSLLCYGVPYPIVFDPIFGDIIWDKQKVKDTFYIRDPLPHHYQLTYKLDTNCIIKGNIAVNRKDCNDLYVPTAFSPNNDLQNDFFQPYPRENHKILSILVFNRWGNLVFESIGNNFSWDGNFNGTPSVSGVYIYLIKYFDSKTGRDEVKTGDVTLIR